MEGKLHLETCGFVAAESACVQTEGNKLLVADGLPGVHKAEILGLCDEVDILSRQLNDMCRRGHGNTPQAQEIARALSQKLYDLKDRIQNAVVNRVVEDFIDISTPLKQFTDAVHVLEDRAVTPSTQPLTQAVVVIQYPTLDGATPLRTYGTN
ncbi:hypothetical protein PR048_004760 [Dryococelus australis]|uniref:Vinculin n=1 Tax=Dryococelus australis TaxID=614101 RepID=A0ABQ9I7C0_9NEOP|nr:hypothetical protein PR048_004760 [Dryococelus australis]